MRLYVEWMFHMWSGLLYAVIPLLTHLFGKWRI